MCCFLNTACLLFAVSHFVSCETRVDQQHWKDMATLELQEALGIRWNLGIAKNVILFVGDGMGPNTVTATRIYKGGESHQLAFEKFPHVGLLKTYSADYMVPDSASTATALFCGVKANMRTAGVDATVHVNDCEASLNPENRPTSLVALAQKAGKSTGFVTTMRVTHATPAPLYAHVAHRNWECEANLPADSKCKDIARQLIEDEPGNNINVIMGGGRQVLKSNVTDSIADPIDSWGCVRRDGRDLMKSYEMDKNDRSLSYKVVTTNGELKNALHSPPDYILGIFANGHLKLEHERDTSDQGMPSIADMVDASLKILRKNQKGYFLMVEGGNIDMAHHRGKAKRAINEAAALEDAVKLAASLTSEEDTLIIVTSDHTHTLSINGYPKAGTDIFGIASASKIDGTNYTTLSYATGGPGSFKYFVVDEGNETIVAREEPSHVNTTDFEYEQLASIKTDENTHGGGDVIVYAKGPYAHLFHNVHEQHYVYNVISFAAKMGEYSRSSNAIQNFSLFMFMINVIFVLII